MICEVTRRMRSIVDDLRRHVTMDPISGATIHDRDLDAIEVEILGPLYARSECQLDATVCYVALVTMASHMASEATWDDDVVYVAASAAADAIETMPGFDLARWDRTFAGSPHALEIQARGAEVSGEEYELDAVDLRWYYCHDLVAGLAARIGEQAQRDIARAVEMRTCAE